MARVDIVIPCYNYGHFLEACVHSVLDQSLREVRVLIIDDASSDDSPEIARKLAASDSRVSVSLHKQNQGHINTYNEGIAWAQSDYFALLSADDLFVPGCLDRAAQIMDANPDVVFAHGDAFVWQDNSPLPEFDAQPNWTWVRQDLVTEMCTLGANVVFTPTAIGRTSVQKAVGGYRAALPHSADMEMWLRFGAQGSVARIDAVQAVYRKHSTNMSDAYFGEDWGDYWHRKATFDLFFGEFGDRMSDRRGLQSLATQALAGQAFDNGVRLVRSGLHHSKRDRVSKGLKLLRASLSASPAYGARRLLHGALERGGKGRIASSVKHAAGKLRART